MCLNLKLDKYFLLLYEIPIVYLFLFLIQNIHFFINYILICIRINLFFHKVNRTENHDMLSIVEKYSINYHTYV